MRVKVEHRGGDRYRVRIYVGRGLDGKPRRASRDFRAKNQREANKLAAEHEAALRRELSETRDRSATVDGLIDDWERLPRAASTTYRNQSIVREIRKAFGSAKLDRLATRDIDLWYASLLASGRSPSTVNHYHRVLASMMAQAEAWGRVPIAPTRRARPPKRPKPNPRPPATDVLGRLIADASPSLQLAALLAARLGLRRGEICGLRWADLERHVSVVDGQEVERWTIDVRRSISDIPGQGLAVKLPKNDESVRSVALDDATVAALAVWRETSPGDSYILADPVDPTQPRRPGWVSLAWSRLCAGHGVKVRFHDLRHWSATNMIGAGVDIKTASSRLGHSLASTTLNMYAKALPGADADAARLLGALLPGPTPDRSVMTE